MGKSRLVIWHDGSISLAQFGTAKRMKIGTNWDENIQIPTEPVTCDTDYCTCLPDIIIPKWRADVQL